MKRFIHLKMLIQIAMALISVTAFCHDIDAHVQISIKSRPGLIDTSIKSEQDQYAYINSIVKEKGITYAVVDYIQFLVGKEAYNAAKKHGDLDTAYDENGKMEVSLDNDIYILNENKKLRKIPLASNVEVIICDFQTGSLSYIKSTLANLAKNIPSSPFSLVIRNGKIVEIHEVYVP